MCTSLRWNNKRGCKPFAVRIRSVGEICRTSVWSLEYTPVHVSMITSWPITSLTPTITIKRVLNLWLEIPTLIIGKLKPKKTVDCGLGIRVRVSRLSRTLTATSNACTTTFARYLDSSFLTMNVSPLSLTYRRRTIDCLFFCFCTSSRHSLLKGAQSFSLPWNMFNCKACMTWRIIIFYKLLHPLYASD